VALIAVIIGAAAASAGFCLFIVPGIIVGLGLEMSTLLIVDQRVGPFEALTESWRLMDGEKLELFALWIVLGLANLVGLCLCGLPWLILLPFGTVCQAWIYNQLVEAKGAFAASGA
jgi:uncharacterized membrane protein